MGFKKGDEVKTKQGLYPENCPGKCITDEDPVTHFVDVLWNNSPNVETWASDHLVLMPHEPLDR